MGSFGNDAGRLGHSRKGLSFVEFAGCICALGGGVALGSFYLGVDMKTMCATVLEQAEIVEAGYFGDDTTEAAAAEENSELASDNAEEAHNGTTSAATATSDTTVASSESSTSDTAPANEDPNAFDEDLAQADAEETELTEEERFVATKKYWAGLVKCINQEVGERTTTPGNHDSWQLFDYLSHRAEGHEKAVEAIDQLEELGVDAKLLLHAKQVRTWHNAGAQLYRRAVNLLTDSTNDQLTGPFAQSWQSAATQHRMEEKLVRDKHASLASYLEHAYKDVGTVNPAH